MAANLDKAESSLTTVSDLSFIRGIDSSGNSVKISKTDLASVLGVAHFESKTIATDLASLPNGVYATNNATNFGLGSIYGSNRIMVIKCHLGLDYMYMAIDMEGNKGVYTSYALSSWTKQ